MSGPRVAVIVGSALAGPSAGVLPASDRAAVALAVGWPGAEVVAYSWRADETALAYALGAGAREARVAADPEGLAFDVAVIGTGGLQGWGDVLPGRLAEARGAALVFDVLAAEPGASPRVVRDLGRGGREDLVVNLPAVLVMSPGARGRYVSRHRIGRGRAELRRADLRPGHADDRDPGGWVPFRPRAKQTAAGSASGRADERADEVFGLMAGQDRAEHVIRADPATCARHLLRYLRHHGLIEGGPVDSVPVPAPAAASATPPALQTARARPGVVPVRVGRGPRPLDGRSTGMARRPRPVDPAAARAVPPRLSRGPRPVGEARRPGLRGPFAVAFP